MRFWLAYFDGISIIDLAPEKGTDRNGIRIGVLGWVVPDTQLVSY